MWLGVLPGAKDQKGDVTMWWNLVDIVPNVPKGPVQGLFCADLTEVSATAIDVVPIPVPHTSIPVPPIPALMSYRSY